MPTILDQIASDWKLLAIPLVVTLAGLIVTLWLRMQVLRSLERRMGKIGPPLDQAILRSVRLPLIVLCLSFSFYLGVAVSALGADWKRLAANSLWTLFMLALVLGLFGLGRGLILHYSRRSHLSRRVTRVVSNVFRITIVVVAALVVLQIWGAPVSALLLAIGVLALLLILGFRDAIPNLLAGLQLAASKGIVTGDFIRLEEQEGQVIGIGWSNTLLRAPDGRVIILPNNALLNRQVVNLGRQLKKAKEPFVFNTRAHLPELTGLKARNLQELVAILKQAPDSMVYIHTHLFIEERQYTVPQLSNDFATWVNDSLGNARLAERLASIDPFEFRNLSELRDRFVGQIEDFLATDAEPRSSLPGGEFYFLKSLNIILPTSYRAGDLRQFAEAIKQISPGSLYYHIFESKIRLGQELNDFSLWLEKSLDEPNLSREIARIDPYSYTLEGLRSLLVQVIERHLRSSSAITSQ